MNFKRLAGPIAAVALVFTMAQPAQASTGDGGFAVLAGECGSSYSRVGTYNIEWDPYGTVVGKMEVYWSSATKRNCLITRAFGETTQYYSTKVARITVSATGASDVDNGLYLRKAGPVYTPAGYNMTGKCINITGKSGVNVGSAVDVYLPARTINRIHCG
jgi:hypothetical protein